MNYMHRLKSDNNRKGRKAIVLPLSSVFLNTDEAPITSIIGKKTKTKI